MTRQVRRHGRLVDPTTGRAVSAPKELLHPAVQAKMAQEADDFSDHEQLVASLGSAPPADHRQFVDADDIEASRAAPATAQSDAYEGQSAYGEYANNVGPQMVAPARTPSYQRGGMDTGAGYLSNPFDEEGRQRMGQQFWEAPGGGHVRRALTGREVFGHKITGGQARLAEQGLAGLTAVGIGVPAFMAAVQQLSTPPDQNTIPL